MAELVNQTWQIKFITTDVRGRKMPRSEVYTVRAATDGEGRWKAMNQHTDRIKANYLNYVFASAEKL